MNKTISKFFGKNGKFQGVSPYPINQLVAYTIVVCYKTRICEKFKSTPLFYGISYCIALG